jgi:phosphatidylserine/phosphatidylglycerophosphate/cardiolipin synthase-like enzyme
LVSEHSLVHYLRMSPQDHALPAWFVTSGERRNRSSTLRAFTTGNLVRAHVHGRSYFARLREVVAAMGLGDQLSIAAFRVDGDELLDGPGSTVSVVVAAAVRRGVELHGLVWRSQPGALDQSEEQNADFVRDIQTAGGDLLLDARTRRAGSHHQKLVIALHPANRTTDVAFLGGIDLARSRNDDADHAGDPQAMAFPVVYGKRPPWHDVQVEVQGPAVGDLALTFRERWEGSTPLDLPSPLRMLWDRTYHAGAMTGGELPAALPDPPDAGPHAVQVLRTYPARWRRYPFAPLGERSIAAAYRKVLGRAHRLIYIEDQYLWAPGVARLLGRALDADKGLHLIAVVPRWADKEGRSAKPSLLGRERAVDVCRAAGGDRFAIYDVENHDGNPVYVHAKVVIVDDVWAMVGSDNLNRRSWTHDSELSCAVLDETFDLREPRDPAGLGDRARVFARDLRLELLREHLDRAPDGSQDADLLDGATAFAAAGACAAALDAWYDRGCAGPRPPGRLRTHAPERVRRRDKIWAIPLSRLVYDPDGRAVRDRVLRRS